MATQVNNNSPCEIFPYVMLKLDFFDIILLINTRIGKLNMIVNNIAPDIKRQRLLIEGFYNDIEVNEQIIINYFAFITKNLDLKPYGEPIIFSPESLGKPENQGYDAFIPLIDSGISLYIWTNSNFMSLIIYTCKDFAEEKAINLTKEFFNFKDFYSQSF